MGLPSCYQEGHTHAHAGSSMMLTLCAHVCKHYTLSRETSGSTEISGVSHSGVSQLSVLLEWMPLPEQLLICMPVGTRGSAQGAWTCYSTTDRSGA